MGEQCEVCGGRQTITLPIIRSASMLGVDVGAEMTATMVSENFKRYPCPECAPRSNVQHVRFVEHHMRIDVDERLPPEALDAQKRVAAVAMAAKLIERGYVEFRDDIFAPSELAYREAIGRPTKCVVATLRVISKADGQNLDGRVIDHVKLVAERLASEAKAEIDNWGSAYGHADILKRDARHLIDMAVRKVIKAFSGRKEI